MDHKKVKSKKLPAYRTDRKVKNSFWGFNFIPLVFAQPTPLGQIGGKPKEGFGPWGDLGAQGIKEATGAFTNIISRIIGVMTIIAGIWFIFQFIIGAYGYMTAGGEQQKITSATKKITSGLTGLIIVVAAYAIISLLGKILGFEILNPQLIIEKLRP